MSLVTCRTPLHAYFTFKYPAYQFRQRSTAQYAGLFQLLRNRPLQKPASRPAPASLPKPSPFDDIIDDPNPPAPPWTQIRPEQGEAALRFLRTGMAVERGDSINHLLTTPGSHLPRIPSPFSSTSAEISNDDIMSAKNKLQSVIAALDESIAANKAARNQLDNALIVGTHALNVAKEALDKLALVEESLERGRRGRKTPDEAEVQEVLDDVWSTIYEADKKKLT